MKPKGLLILAFVSIIIVGALHQLGSVFYLYWSIGWFDSLMHYIGTVAIGLLLLWIWYVSGLFGRETPSKKEALVFCLVSVLMVAFGWEFFEYAYDVANPAGGNYALDTFHDFLFGFLGALTAGIIGRTKRFYE
jgi:hypothetical protein